MNRLLLAIILIVAGLASPSPGQAQSPPDASIGGQVQFAQAYGNNRSSWCYVRRGSSQFQRNSNNPTAVISFPEVIYFDGTTYYPLDGQARLTFSSASAGNIKFKFWGTNSAINNPNFTDYSETFNGQQYIVVFNIIFPNNCVLPIFAGFETP